jgi:hypothetical protein
MQPSKERREYWYGRPESLQAQTLAETQKKGDETNLKLPKSITRKPKRSPVWLPIMLSVGNPPTN